MSMFSKRLKPLPDRKEPTVGAVKEDVDLVLGYALEAIRRRSGVVLDEVSAAGATLVDSIKRERRMLRAERSGHTLRKAIVLALLDSKARFDSEKDLIDEATALVAYIEGPPPPEDPPPKVDDGDQDGGNVIPDRMDARAGGA